MNESKKYFGITLDPVHIGAGGYRLGRVDNTIVRDPATDVPKIPGTSLTGAIRAFAEIVKKKEVKKKEGDNKNKEEKEQFTNLKIENVFGDESNQGIVRIYDGQIVFFPVSSIQGTVWITTKELLEYWLNEINDQNDRSIKIPWEIKDEVYAIRGINSLEPLNLGWLLLNTNTNNNNTNNNTKNINDEIKSKLPQEINNFLKRIVIVSDKLFSHIVNDNLEVRTSVRINPKTGTAAEGALFTYEAIPRGTIIGFEILVDTHRDDGKSSEIDSLIKEIYSLIKETFKYLRLLGLGGMGTRGFGSVKFFT